MHGITLRVFTFVLTNASYNKNMHDITLSAFTLFPHHIINSIGTEWYIVRHSITLRVLHSFLTIIHDITLRALHSFLTKQTMHDITLRVLTLFLTQTKITNNWERKQMKLQ